MTLGDDYEIKLIEIYAKELSEEEKDGIIKQYAPEKLEVYYEED